MAARAGRRPGFALEAVSLVSVHEDGGSPEAELLQAADSLSFLEVQAELFAGLVARGELSEQAALAKMRRMYERITLPGLASSPSRCSTRRSSGSRRRRNNGRGGRSMGLLEGRVAIVTGAGTGLGREHALALAAAGASVIVNNRSATAGGTSSAEAVVAEIEAAGGRAVPDTASVADWDAMGALVARAVDELGRLDIVVNNAGIRVWEPIAEIEERA